MNDAWNFEIPMGKIKLLSMIAKISSARESLGIL
jgi:hypothetical protein